MSTQRRVQDQPAFILHHRPFRDSSQLLDVLCREHGKVGLVARGSRAAKSRLRGYLRPFLPIRISYVIRTDLGTLTGAEMHDAPLRLDGDALLSGYYLNELLLHLLHRHDPQPALFDAYREAIIALAAAPDVTPVLRAFEIELLRQLGYALNLIHDAATDEPLRAGQSYEYRYEQGPVASHRTDGLLIFDGAVLTGIAAQRFDDAAVLAAANRLLRQVIGYHLGGKELRSRQVLRDMRAAH